VNPNDVQHLLPKHVDHRQLEFSPNDLEKLVRQATNDLEELDRHRKEEFKDHELEKEFERRRELQVSELFLVFFLIVFKNFQEFG
jgi:hypothetical protein